MARLMSSSTTQPFTAPCLDKLWSHTLCISFLVLVCNGKIDVIQHDPAFHSTLLSLTQPTTNLFRSSVCKRSNWIRHFHFVNVSRSEGVARSYPVVLQHLVNGFS